MNKSISENKPSGQPVEKIKGSFLDIMKAAAKDANKKGKSKKKKD